MKFSEKLQYLRKENKFSQEQLADMLDVSRQAVSKWESGQTYPEMDKLLSMCKIFKCSLDDLTNDEIKEIKYSSGQKNYIKNILDDLVELINKSVEMFKKMKSQDIAKFFVVIALMFILFAVFKIPVNYINELGRTLFFSFGQTVGNVISSIWNFILEISYFVLCVVVLIYFYKEHYLDKYDSLVADDKPIDDAEEEKPEEKKEKIQTVKREHSYVIFDVLSSIALYFIKFIVICMSIPFVFILISLCMALVICILLIIKGVVFIGLIIGIIASIILCGLFMELIFSFIADKKIDVKKVFIIFVISISALGVAAGVTVFDIADIKFIDSAPSKEKIYTVSQDYEFKKNMYFNENYYYSDIEYIEDNTLINSVKIEVKYYKKYINLFINNEDGQIALIKNYDKIVYNDMVNLIVEDLSKEQMHNYAKLYSSKVKIYTSLNNINIMKANREEYNNKIIEENIQNELNYYEKELNEKESRIYDLEQEVEALNNKNEEYENKIQEYKNKINELMGL